MWAGTCAHAQKACSCVAGLDRSRTCDVRRHHATVGGALAGSTLLAVREEKRGDDDEVAETIDDDVAETIEDETAMPLT